MYILTKRLINTKIKLIIEANEITHRKEALRIMDIFKCGADHIDLLTEFYYDVTSYLVSHVNYPKWTHGVYPGKESISAAVHSDTQYACIDNGKIVGAFILNTDPQGDYSKGDWQLSLNDGEYMVIHSLAVSPRHYGKGIAIKMVRFCVETAASSGFRSVRLDVVPENLPAKRLYEKAGFVFAGEKDLNRGIADIPTFLLYEKALN